MSDYRTRHSAIASAVMLALASAAASAQEGTTTLDEITVTAQKRTESLQDVPIAVSAVSGTKIAEAGILKIEDLKNYVPTLFMTETAIGNNISIRGIFSGVNPGFEQSVGTYVDGIYRGRPQQTRAAFLDLERGGSFARPAINPVRQEFFGDSRPASTLVEVKALALPGMHVEIEAVVGLSSA